MSEIWVTGIGIVSPLGIGREAVGASLLEGESGIGEISLFETGDYPVRTGAEVKDFQARKYVRNRKALKVSRRNIHLALAAGNLAWEDAELEGQVEPERAGVIMSAGRLGATLDEVCYAVRDALDENGRLSLEKYAETSAKIMPPYWFLRHIPNLVPGSVAIELGLKAPCNTICLNVVGSLVALDEAASIIDRGEADVMLAGGADCLVDPYHIVTHHQLGRLDITHEDGPRPFSPESCGTILGETGTIAVLERSEFARARGKEPLAVWKGFQMERHRVGESLRTYSDETGPKPNLTVLGGTGLLELDELEMHLAHPESSLACYRNRTGWLGGSNGIHDLACTLLDRQIGQPANDRYPNPVAPPIRGKATGLDTGDIVRVQSLSWSGLYGSAQVEVR